MFVVDYKVPASGREYGTVFLGKDTETGENISEEIVRLGLASVRKEGKADVARLVELEEKAKAESVGKWGEENEVRLKQFVKHVAIINDFPLISAFTSEYGMYKWDNLFNLFLLLSRRNIFGTLCGKLKIRVSFWINSEENLS